MNPSEIKESSKRMTPVAWLVRESAAIALWALILVKLIIFDIDIYLIERYSPWLRRALDFKFFVLVGLVAVLWVVLGKQRFRSFVLYLAAYPLVVLLWKIPKAALRRWPVVIALLPALYDLVRTLRTTFALYALAMIAALVVSLSYNHALLILSMCAIGAFLLAHLIRSSRRAYKANVFSRLTSLVRKIRSDIEAGSFAESLSKEPATGTEEERATQIAEMDIVSCFYANVLFDYVAEKVRQAAKGGKVDLYLICLWFYTVLITVIAYAFEYLGLYKLSPEAFAGSVNLNFWSFLGFSFSALIPSQVSPVTAAAQSSRLLCYTEGACGLVILVILVFIILTAARQVYREDIQSFIGEMHLITAAAEKRLGDVYALTISQIETAQFRHTPDFINRLRKARGLPELPPSKEEAESDDTAESGKQSADDNPDDVS